MNMNFIAGHDAEPVAFAPRVSGRASLVRRMRVAIAWSRRVRKRRRQSAATMKALSRLNDHTLKDIGLQRGDLVGRW